ncbi:MAG: polymer-forming cytoskeletal protein [Treponema sp.]|nr:polymer-forming cytoskeletal protein [Treponema sp.]
MALRFDDFSFNTLIGEASVISGTLHINGSVRIEGDIDGNLETDGNVQIGERARIRGNIDAKSAIIRGIVLGDIIAKEGVFLLSSAVVLGDIISKKVQIEENVVFHGHCISLSEDEKYEAASEQYLQAKAIRGKAVFA